MNRTVEATLGEDGSVRLLQRVHLTGAQRVLVTILDEQPVDGVHENALLSEQALAQDWSRPEEDAAWSHLQSHR